MSPHQSQLRILQTLSINHSMNKKIRLKICIIGPPSSGKSSFIQNLLNHPFNSTHTKTESYELSMYKFAKDRTEYEIQLWQCGCEHLSYNKHIRQAYFRNASAAFLMFDLCEDKWKQIVEEWLAEAYEFDCFLVYAIGTKRDLLIKKKYESLTGVETFEPEQLTQSLLQSKGIETLDELEINKFFEQFQIKHFYQSATEKMHKSIRNIFISIQNDQQKLTRSSLAVGRRFDNTVIDIRGEEKDESVEMVMESIKLEEVDEREEEQETESPRKSKLDEKKQKDNQYYL